MMMPAKSSGRVFFMSFSLCLVDYYFAVRDFCWYVPEALELTLTNRHVRGFFLNAGQKKFFPHDFAMDYKRWTLGATRAECLTVWHELFGGFTVRYNINNIRYGMIKANSAWFILCIKQGNRDTLRNRFPD